MGRANHPGLRISQQDRAAIGGNNAEHDAARCGHHRIGNRASCGSIIPCGIGNHDIGRMHLMRRGELSAGQNRVRRRRPQGAHCLPITRPAKAELMHPACTAEKAVRDAG